MLHALQGPTLGAVNYRILKKAPATVGYKREFQIEQLIGKFVLVAVSGKQEERQPARKEYGLKNYNLMLYLLIVILMKVHFHSKV